MKTFIPFLKMFGKQRNAEHYDTHYNIVHYIDEKVAKIPDFSTPYQRYKESFLREKILYKPDAKAPETALIIQADELRDKTKKKLNREVEYRMYSDVAAEQEAAQIIKHTLLVYKEAENRPYADNSAMIDNLVVDLRKEPCSAAIATLRLESVVNLLEEQNKAFMVLYRRRARRTYNETSDSLRELRRQTDLTFENVANLLLSIYHTNYNSNPKSELTVLIGDLIDAINSYLVQAQSNLSRHSSSESSHKAKPSAPDITPPSGLPVLYVSEQKMTLFYEDNFDLGKQMDLKMADPERFRELLYPDIIGGVLRMQFGDEGEIYDFPIIEFVMDPLYGENQQAIGIGVGKPGKTLYYALFKPGVPADGLVIKDDQIIVRLTNTFCPVIEEFNG